MWNTYYSQAKNQWIVTLDDRDMAVANDRAAAELIADGLNLLNEEK